MKRVEAITVLEEMHDSYDEIHETTDGDIGYEQMTALDMAIEALQIDVVRCEDCIKKHIGGSVTQYYWCDFWDKEIDYNNGCSWGERKGGDVDGNRD